MRNLVKRYEGQGVRREPVFRHQELGIKQNIVKIRVMDDLSGFEKRP